MRKLAILFLLLLVPSIANAQAVPKKVWDASDSVCKVMVSQGNSRSYGSGTYLGARLVVTAAHVIDRIEYGWVHFSATDEAIRFRTWAGDDNLDFAVLHLYKEPSCDPVKLACEPVRRGDNTYIVGHPNAVQQLQIARSIAGDVNGPYLTTYNEAGIISGFSGGATLNAQGELLGPVWGSRYHRKTGFEKNARSVCQQQTRRFLLPWNARLAATGIYAGST